MAKRKNSNRTTRIRYIEYDPNEKQPKLAVYALDRKRKVLKSSDVEKNGEFSLADNVVEKADRIVIGPKDDDISKLDRKLLATYRPSQFKTIAEGNGRFEIPKKKWYPWLTVRQCVSGSVTHCHGYPWLLASLTKAVNLGLRSSFITKPVAKNAFSLAGLSAGLNDNLSDSEIAYPAFQPRFRKHCHTVCDGVVEVYRRTCCCQPWIIYDPRLDDLLAELERLRDVPPPDPWPPRPQPDPVPFERLSLFKGATLNEDDLSTGQDLLAIRALPAEAVPAYINARPHLFCHCGTAEKGCAGVHSAQW